MLRSFFATIDAVARGLASAIAGSYRGAPVELRPGDRAPDFSLAGSDGRTYRLSEFEGRQPVVLAWFPRAFTAG